MNRDGAPATNSNEGGFKPPFPSYPSGHATFAAAGFQMVRLFYNQRSGDIFKTVVEGSRSGQGDQKPTPPKPNRDVDDDKICFTVISDELNGISRDLYQPYDPSVAITNQNGDVRTRVPMNFNSVKDAIFSNAISRIWLGVHWHFDAFAGEDIFIDYKNGGAGKDNNQPHPKHYKQLYQVEADGSTMYQKVAGMDWFAHTGKMDGAGSFPTG